MGSIWDQFLDMDQVDEAIRQANQALGRIKILRRDRKLALRGVLPCRPGEGQSTKRAVISLGIYANPAGVKVAIAKAQRLESDLNLDRFCWSDWLDGELGEVKTAATWGAEFGAVKAASVKPQSYRANYEEPLASLPDKPLTEDMLIALGHGRSPADSWSRKNDCMVFKQVAKFAGVTVDFSSIKGRYSPALLSPGDVPTDEEIEATCRAISNPGWAWVYGMLATYALRHAWAIRSAVMGVPDSIAARWMGHSVAVHAKTYHAAIDQL